MRVVIIGGGPVGLVSGAVLADIGHQVCVVDIDPERTGCIARGEAPFHEPGLPDLLRHVVGTGRLVAATDAAAPVRAAEVILICVGTPPTGHGADLAALRAAAVGVGEALAGAPGYRAVAVKSTVPPGTTVGVVEPLLRAHSGLGPEGLGVGMNPEFLREGVAVADMRTPDRIVLGVGDDRVRSAFEELYQPFQAPLIFTTPTGAEMAKYASNALLATLVSFANEVAALCESVAGADAVDVLRAVHADRRFRPPPGAVAEPAAITSYLLPGLGYGGSCFPKDTEALAAWASERRTPTPILDAVRLVNAERPERVLALLRSRITLAGARIAVLGLTFKPDTDDLRESRSLHLVRLLHAAGATVSACDPMAAAPAGTLLAGIAEVSPDPETALAGADAAIVATAWPSLVALDPTAVRRLMRRPLVLDARRSLDAARWSAHCEYLPIGVMA